MFTTDPNKKRWSHIQKHHATIWQTMKRILENEPWNKTLSDKKLAEAVRNEGVYATAGVVREIRIAHRIGGADERRISAFARAHKEKQRKEGK